MSENPDRMKNRRRMAWAMQIFAVVWFMQIFWVDALLMQMSTSKVTAYIGVPEILAGLISYKYHKACERDGGND